MTTLREKLTIGAFWTISFRFASRLLGIISTAILARLLVPEDFGLVTLAATSVAIANAFTEFGPEHYLISHQDCNRDEYDTAWTLQIIRGVLISGLMIIFSEEISYFFNEPRLGEVLVILSLGLLARSFANIGIVDFRKKLNFDKDFKILLYPRLVSFFSTILLAIAWGNYWALIWGLMIGHLAHIIASYGMHKFRPKITLTSFRKVFGFSKWVFANSILQFLIYKFDTFLIGRVLGTRMLGLYSVSFEISTLATSELAAPIRRAMLPGYSKVSNNAQALQDLYLDVFALTMMVTFPVAIGVISISDLIVFTILGDKWVDAIPIIEIVAIVGALQAIGGGASPLFLAIKRPRNITFIMLGTFIPQVPLMLWAADANGIIGIAWALIATWLWRILLTLYFVSQAINARIRDHVLRTWRTLASAILMYYVVSTFRNLLFPHPESLSSYVTALISSISIGALTFTIAHILLWLTCGKPQGPELQGLSAFSLIYKKTTGKDFDFFKRLVSTKS